MSSALFGTTFDAADALRTATFWAAALGRDVADGGSAVAAALAGDPRVSFRRVPHDTAVKNRVHLDLTTDDLTAESERLVSLGASKRAETDAGAYRFASMSDPEGNEFDLIAF